MCLYGYIEIRLLPTDVFFQDNVKGNPGYLPAYISTSNEKKILNTSDLAGKLYLFMASQEISSRQNRKRVSCSILITFTSLNLIANMLICKTVQTQLNPLFCDKTMRVEISILHI